MTQEKSRKRSSNDNGDQGAGAAKSLKTNKIPPSASTESVPVTVEFLFTSCKTRLVREGEFSGYLHVPMFQDPKTGRCSIPQGTTTAKGVVQRRCGYARQEEEITATFVKAFDQISDFRLGYDLEYFQE